jgi:hypothetical protein
MVQRLPDGGPSNGVESQGAGGFANARALNPAHRPRGEARGSCSRLQDVPLGHPTRHSLSSAHGVRLVLEREHPGVDPRRNLPPVLSLPATSSSPWLSRRVGIRAGAAADISVAIRAARRSRNRRSACLGKLVGANVMEPTRLLKRTSGAERRLSCRFATFGGSSGKLQIDGSVPAPDGRSMRFRIS